MTQETSGSGADDSLREVWISRLQAGLITGLMAVVYSISHASLVTGGAAPQATATVTGMALIGTAVLCFTLGQASGIKGVIPIVQDVPTAALGAILVSLLAAQTTAAQGVTTAEIVALCLASGLAFAAAIYLFGTFRLAAIMRFAPRPVIAGFLAGTGYFVIVGAIGICLGASPSWQQVPTLFTAPTFPKIAVAILVAFGMVLGGKLLPPKLAITAVVGGALLIFHLSVLMLGLDMTALTAKGWFTAVPAGGLPWPPINSSELAGLDLSFLVTQIFPLCTMIVLATAALLMNLSAIEAKTRGNIDLDRELKVLGLSNLAATGLGGLPGYHGGSTTFAGLRIAAGHRTVTMIAGMIPLLVFFFGNTVLAVLPLPIFAGFILWVGSGLIREWLIDEIRVTPPSEAWLTVAIFIVVAAVGLFEGTIFGLAAGGILFIVNYSRLDPIQGELFGDVVHGSDEMTSMQLKILEAHGNAIAILRVQGYVFFGTAYGLNDRIKSLLKAHPVSYLILDFEGVTGIDATAVVTFGGIADDLHQRNVHATFAGLSDRVTKVLERAGLPLGEDEKFAAAPDMNTALTRYETLVLEKHMPADAKDPKNISAMLEAFLGDASLAERLKGYLRPVELESGERLMTAGEDSRDMYIVESGRLEVLIVAPSGPKRVRTMGAGALVGEISYLSDGTRTSSVRAITQAKLWCFSAQTAADILVQDPELSSRFYAGLAKVLAERVKANTRLIQMLSR